MNWLYLNKCRTEGSYVRMVALLMCPAGKYKEKDVHKLFTNSIVFLISRSAQSCVVTVAVSGKPPKITCTIAGLRPDSLGPLCKKLRPIILPAIWKRSLNKDLRCGGNKVSWFSLKQNGLASVS